MILIRRIRLWLFMSILHVCGGDPCLIPELRKYLMYSPRMWRWSLSMMTKWQLLMVFSTYVEVILREGIKRITTLCILHVCGGDPKLHQMGRIFGTYSPRMWRWSSFYLVMIKTAPVFSTYVEVIHMVSLLSFVGYSILHVCGGDPAYIPWLVSIYQYSPRMWRWSY